MGTAGCKSLKLPTQNQQKDDNKNIIIGVFGLDDAGKTSTVKAIEGDPTENVQPTMSSTSTMVANPLHDRPEKNKKQQSIKIIDVSGERKFRQKSWTQYYDQIHGLIFVIDASERKRLRENQATLEDLLEHEKLKNKPILILANKQDQKGAISTENDLKRQLDIEKLKAKYKIELCTALPKNAKNKVDESIRKGFSWLIRTINDNYTELNACVTKAKNPPIDKKTNRLENENEKQYFKEKTPSYHSKITSEKLPSINTNKPKVYNDDDDDDNDYVSSKNNLNKKKKVVSGTTNNDRSNDNQPKAFRSTYEAFPEETPWSLSSMLKPTKSDDTFPRLNTKSSFTHDTKRRDVSPLVHDTKSYTNGSLSKRNNNDDDEEEDFYPQQKPKTTTRFDNSTFPTNRFSSNTKKPTSGIHDEDDGNDYTKYNNRRNVIPPKKPYNRDDDNDDDEYNYLKKPATTKSNKNYDLDDNKNYQRSSNRSNVNTDYRGTVSKPGNHSKYDDDDDDDDYSTTKPTTRSTYNNDYSTSKSINRSKYNDEDDDDDKPRWSSSSKPATNSKYDNEGYPSSSSKLATRSNYDHGDRSFSSSKPISQSNFDDDDYPSSSSKAVARSKYNQNDDDDDDDYPSSVKKNNYGSSPSRSRFANEDFFTTKDGSNTTSRFRKNTDYDS